MKDNNTEFAKRMIWLDAAKGLGMILVIIGHGPTISENLWKLIWTFHMPFFFFLSGYTFHVNNDTEQLINKKFKRLIIPYIFTVIMLMVIDLIRQIVTSTPKMADILSICFRWIWGGVYGSCWPYEAPFLIYDIGAIWFLVTLFCAELILNEILKFEFEYMIPIIILGLGYIGFASKEFIWLPWNMQASFVMLSVMYAGYICKKANILMKTWKGLHFILFPLAFICIINGSCVIVGNNTYTYGVFSIIGAVVISMYFCKASALLFNNQNKITKIVSFFGRNSIVVLCFHLIELDMFPWGNICYQFTNPAINNCVIIGLKIVYAFIMIMLVEKIQFLQQIFYRK